MQAPGKTRICAGSIILTDTRKFTNSFAEKKCEWQEQARQQPVRFSAQAETLR
jgi:hypothetical protein